MKDVILGKQARKTMNTFPKLVKQRYTELMGMLQINEDLPAKDFKSMNSVSIGAYEMRIKDSSGAYRIFYYLKHRKGIIVFHAFTKKTQKTPQKEIEAGRMRLTTILEELNG